MPRDRHEVDLRVGIDDLISREIREASQNRWSAGLVGVYHDDNLQAVLGIDSTLAPLPLDDDDIPATEFRLRPSEWTQ